MKIKYLVILALLTGSSLFIAGCQQEQSNVSGTGVIEANQAYYEHFGELPPVKEGQAFATVGYLPLKDDPAKLSALPIFLFSLDNRLENVLNRLVSGELTKADKTSFYNPFPEDLELTIQPLEGRTLALDLGTDTRWRENDLEAAVNALRETALQFEEIEQVKIYLNGSPLPGMPANGYQHNAQLIAAVSPPSLILMAGAWEAAGDVPEELLIEFDRPVKVQSFQLSHVDGRKVEGDYFTSVFQMAVIVHPKSPQQFQQGTMLRAQWHVVDYLGRENRGNDIMALKKYLH